MPDRPRDLSGTDRALRHGQSVLKHPFPLDRKDSSCRGRDPHGTQPTSEFATGEGRAQRQGAAPFAPAYRRHHFACFCPCSFRLEEAPSRRRSSAIHVPSGTVQPMTERGAESAPPLSGFCGRCPSCCPAAFLRGKRACPRRTGYRRAPRCCRSLPAVQRFPERRHNFRL